MNNNNIYNVGISKYKKFLKYLLKIIKLYFYTIKDIYIDDLYILLSSIQQNRNLLLFSGHSFIFHQRPYEKILN